MMTESDKERFNMRIGGEVIIWDYLKNENGTADIGADVKVIESFLYDRISQYAFLHGEDLQGMFKNERYEYMSCFIRDVAAFRTEFENEEMLQPLFNHDKGESAEYLISFPENESCWSIMKNQYIDSLENGDVMDFSKIDFSHDCYVDLHVGDYGSLSGLFFTGKTDLVTLEQLFTDSHDWQDSFHRDGRQYVTGFVEPGNVQFIAFMQNAFTKEKEHDEKFFLENGFYEQSHDFFDIWFDSDVREVQISFPTLKTE